MKRHTLSAQELCDLELLLDGSFNPLKGFMNYNDYISCLNNYRLVSGDVWPIPITLASNESYKIGTSLALCQIDGPVIAQLLVESTWEINVNQECLSVYKTLDKAHPGVAAIQSRQGMFYVGGSLSPGSVTHYDFSDLRMSPDAVKKKISSKWKKVVAFHTRNPMHNSHLTLVKNAALSVGPDCGILIHPTVGITQSKDIDYWTRVKCYKKLLSASLSEDSYVLAIIPLSMRMAGPREALLHAIVRRNYGCTHFVMGRDPAGPSACRSDNNEPFYGKYDAHDLVAQFTFTELGIQIIKAQELSYNPLSQDYTASGTLSISGTELRRLISSKEPVPYWFTTSEVIDVLSETAEGCCIYLLGLSGSGKTTLARALTERLRENLPSNKVVLLDGDDIRRNLSAGLGFSREDRSINVRRIGYVADLLTKSGNIVVCANIAPYEADRKWNRELMTGRYLEVYLNTSLKVCEERDCKGLYKAAREGKIKQFTGISDTFEEPQNPDIVLDTSTMNVEACMKKILSFHD